jgi:4-(2-carboxyphenyl)-2-oxobut-3-enoate aldolase
MGPEPCVALSAAINAGDEPRIQEIIADMRSLPRAQPPRQEGDPNLFPSLNTQFEKARFRAAGFVNCGMPRAPYSDDDLPDTWKASAEVHGKAWAEMRKKYIRAAV